MSTEGGSLGIFLTVPCLPSRDVKDLGSEEVHVYLWDNDEGAVPTAAKGTEKSSGIRR